MRRSLPSFLGLRFLNLSEKLAIARALLAIRREHSTRPDLERITMQQWLEEKRQPARAIERFWRQVLVSAVNEDLDRMAAIHGFQVFRAGIPFQPRVLSNGRARGAAGASVRGEAWRKLGKVEILPRTPAQRVIVENGEVRGLATAGGELRADFYISAVPFDRVWRSRARAGSLDWSRLFEHSPITGIHLWFDRPITDLPHATLLDRTIQWMFNKSQGPLYRAGGQRLAQPGRDQTRRRDRAGAARAGRILPGGAARRAWKNRTWSRKSARRFPPSPASKRTGR